jgi:hypothetical protein
MRTLGRVIANDDSTLDAFLESVWNQLLTQSAQFTQSTREAYCTKAFLCMALAFVCGLKSEPAPVNPNALDTPAGEALGGGIGFPAPPPALSTVPAYATIQHPLPPTYAPPPIE